MTRIAKLHAWIVANPQASLRFRDFERLLVAAGFTLQRVNGSHRLYHHADLPVVMNVQPRGKDAKSYQIAQFIAIIKEHGLTLGDD